MLHCLHIADARHFELSYIFKLEPRMELFCIFTFEPRVKFWYQ